MKNALIALALFALPLSAATLPDYSGEWVYDASSSTDMPRMFEKVTHWTLNVKQNAKQLTTSVRIENSEMPTYEQSFTYALDGSETKTETSIMTPDGPRPVPTTLQAKVGEAGVLQLTITRELPMNGEPVRGIIHEDWTLSKDGHTLTIHRRDDGPRKADMTIVFQRGGIVPVH
ncbi:MAG TPA: hypothetical protein VJZ00_17425 [Thermoanaerobaculia bacterium]|nr:hypothetical protein [Thermoanaerobaculia bacterium]